jgi:hypothetical protein
VCGGENTNAGTCMGKSLPPEHIIIMSRNRKNYTLTGKLRKKKLSTRMKFMIEYCFLFNSASFQNHFRIRYGKMDAFGSLCHKHVRVPEM